MLKEKDITQIGFKTIARTEKTRWVRHQFDAVAKRYDLMNTLLSFGIHHLWKRTAIKMLSLKPGHGVLDLCGGTGDLAVAAGKITGPTGRVVLYDINREMMSAGKSKPAHAGLRRRIAYVEGDAEQMALPDNAFDAAIVGFGIRNLTDMEKGFREMYRVLKPGGTMVCLEFSRPTIPLFRWCYDMYSFHIMPCLGQLLTGSREAYTYLPESIRLFPLPDKLKAKLEEIGFHNVTFRKLTNGVAVIHRGVK
ncbi:bifunctional demethylmenaquinone methyltransfera se/2-methoxy-6-polyprenyl-1,4-benzoquinol methylase [Desulfonema ishimotonii]|uniref:Demethylmenaquinone methyltransferase n=1 Tax=Desulfonema ishimotonii TaxID=45657 RepID=A0A401FS53_9BACT|nr:bifunctional demethylmenaquinone methyltransferase/2-methoxy-6-polyprenyl-1,4-benzoquinol methylase UbiE [Desulfonema ishimotonii]GBC59797.1 bifunctional demethylmenaquinone methyltransfera se/2-methoxy-6-polyprenyl-1,4-benzoquinol methylase [Desulfonema ishimotonii]